MRFTFYFFLFYFTRQPHCFATCTVLNNNYIKEDVNVNNINDGMSINDNIDDSVDINVNSNGNYINNNNNDNHNYNDYNGSSDINGNKKDVRVEAAEELAKELEDKVECWMYFSFFFFRVCV